MIDLSAEGPAQPRHAVGIRAAGVVLPAHDEERHLGAALSSILDACAASGLPPAATAVIVVLDHCSDGSAAIARDMVAARQGEVVEVACRNVGGARAAGVAALQRRFAGVAPEALWIANTDADSVVPPTWMADQVRLADGGADAVAGVITVVDWSAHPPHLPERFRLHYEGPAGVDDHPHIHGTNLGVRSSAYDAVGGFPPLRHSEDGALWQALRAGGQAVVATRRLAVVTSARRDFHAAHGFGDFLENMAAG